MGDSEDEYDRKRRDKFRGERSEGGYRGGGGDRSMRPRDEWLDRSRPGGYRNSTRDPSAFSPPSLDPPLKRPRQDFYVGGGAGPDSFFPNYSSSNFSSHHREPVAGIDALKQPMSFKEFLVAQDDNISVTDAVEKYNDYRLEFQRQQLNEFFVAHKDEEWFRLKYHPEDSVKRKEEQMKALKKRVEVFLELYNSGTLQNTSIDVTNTNELIRLLDTVVIKLEDGNEEDYAILDKELKEVGEEKKSEKVNEKEAEEKMDVDAGKIKENGKTGHEEDDDDGEVDGGGEVKVEDSAKSKDSLNGNAEENMESDEQKVPEEESKKDVEEDVIVKETVEENNVQVTDISDEKSNEENGVKQMEVDEDQSKPAAAQDEANQKNLEVIHNTESISSDNDEDEHQDPKSTSKDGKDENKVEENGVEDTAQVPPNKEVLKRVPGKPIHKTTSIFLRNLTPSITLKELEDICEKYDGFLRVSLSEPQPDRRWMRRGWVTFTRDANIKEICWNLNNVRIRDCELGSIVNRDLSRRIRQVNGITAHKRVVKSDIRITAKVALHLDSKMGLWVQDGAENETRPNYSISSKNPVLQNITDYLIEEASAEEEELLGLEPSVESEDDMNVTLDRDESLIKVLDRIIWYLRIVHSIDYYNHCEYPNEDEMPNRCGILHARGPVPLTKTDISSFIGTEVETKMANFLPDKSNGDKVDPKLLQLSLKNPDSEIDKFVLANTRELAKDKWLCPLSGKKFKGPDFVRKHIFNKHAEKLEEVKKEVEYFNNYLRDAKRPIDPAMKRDETPITSQTSLSSSTFNAPAGYNTRFFNPSFSRGGRGRGARNPGEYRPIIQYRDLDAPRDLEEFI